MCLYTNWNKPKVATKDIVCYKVLRVGKKYFYSTVYSYTWKDSKVQTSRKFIIEEDYYYVIKNAFHSFKSKKAATCSFYYGKIVKMIIPKGSLYYQNEYKDRYASNKIRIVAFKKQLKELQ